MKEGDPIPDPMEDLGEPTAPDDLMLVVRLAKIESARWWEERNDHITLSRRLAQIRQQKKLEAEFEFKYMKKLAMEVLCRATPEELRRMHAEGPPSFNEILIWATKEAKSLILQRMERWLDFCHGREPRVL